MDQYVCSIKNKIRAQTNDIALVLDSKSPKYEPINLAFLESELECSMSVEVPI